MRLESNSMGVLGTESTPEEAHDLRGYMTPSLQRIQPLTSLDTVARSDMRSKSDQNKRRAKSRLVELLAEAGLSEVADRVARCNEEYLHLTCENGHEVQRIPFFRCRSRLCPYCATERQRRAYTKLLPILESFQRAHPDYRLVSITLTVANSFEPLAVQDKAFKASFRRLRRMRNWKARIRGAVSGYEFTCTPTGWHYHVHILAFRKAWYSQADLADDWSEATRGVGQIVDIRSVSNEQTGLRKALNYCFKPVDLEKWTPDEVQQFQSMRRTKLSECFGELRGFKPNGRESNDVGAESEQALFAGCPCPTCGAPLQIRNVIWRELDTPFARDWFLRARAGPDLVH